MNFSILFLRLNHCFFFFPYHMRLVGQEAHSAISNLVEDKLESSFFFFFPFVPVCALLPIVIRELLKNSELGSGLGAWREWYCLAWNYPSEQSLPSILGFSPICLCDSPFSLTQPSVSRQMIHSQCIFLLFLNRPSNHHCIFQFQLTAWTAVKKKNVTKQASPARKIMQNSLRILLTSFRLSGITAFSKLRANSILCIVLIYPLTKCLLVSVIS